MSGLLQPPVLVAQAGLAHPRSARTGASVREGECLVDGGTVIGRNQGGLAGAQLGRALAREIAAGPKTA